MQEFSKGLLRENPVLRLILGTCPTLAVTTTSRNGLGMGLAATFVLVGSNLMISLLRKVIPDKVRIPAFITVIAGFVSIVQMLLQAYLPELNQSLGIFIPLITVNCIILARAEMFASKNSVLPSVIDGLGMGIGFTTALFLMGSIREIIGNGTFLGWPVPVLRAGGLIEPAIILILPPGGFFVFGLLIALANKLSSRLDKKEAGIADPLAEVCAGAVNNAAACALCSACSVGARYRETHGFQDSADADKPAGHPSGGKP
jgi:electron transport complex protein RnfE